MSAVDSAMVAKGLRKVEVEPDLIVVALVSTESDLTMTNPSGAPVLNSIASGIPTSSKTWRVTMGTLVIAISDAPSTEFGAAQPLTPWSTVQRAIKSAMPRT